MDLLLLIVASLLLIAVVLSITSALVGESSPRPEPAPEPPRVATGEIPAAVAGERFDVALSASGGDGRYSWEVVGGELPEGVELSSDGVVGGVPEASGSFAATVRVTDGDARTADADVALTVEPAPEPPIVVTGEVPVAVQGEHFELALSASGGDGDYSWEVAEGELPEGLELGPDGVVVGEPDVSDSFSATVRVTDGEGRTADAEVVFDVEPPAEDAAAEAPADAEPPRPLWRWGLNIALWIFTIIGIVTACLIAWVIFFGLPPGTSPGVRGLLNRW